MEQQLPENIMRKAVKGISYIAHPLRLRILEYLDVNGSSSVSAITKALGEEQVIISQSLKKMREANLVRTNRRGIFIYYDICEEYPASIFTCLRKLYAMMTDNFYFLEDGVKAILPSDYTMMTANRIKLFANYDKMRILEFLTLYGPQNVTEIVNGIGSEQLKVSQYLKRLKDDGFVISRRQGRIKRHNTWSSIIASSITIGFGGSVGAEAPIVLTGSAIGSNLGTIFKDRKSVV